jgi:hypothetical protein
VRPEVGVRGGVRARGAAGGGGGGGAPAGAAGALLVVGGAAAEGHGLVDLRLAERERQQRPRRVALRRRQRGGHRRAGSGAHGSRCRLSAALRRHGAVCFGAGRPRHASLQSSVGRRRRGHSFRSKMQPRRSNLISKF